MLPIEVVLVRRDLDPPRGTEVWILDDGAAALGFAEDPLRPIRHLELRRIHRVRVLVDEAGLLDISRTSDLHVLRLELVLDDRPDQPPVRLLLDDVVLDDDVLNPLRELRSAGLFNEAGVLVPLRPHATGGEDQVLEVAGEQLSSYCLLLGVCGCVGGRVDRYVVDAVG